MNALKNLSPEQISALSPECLKMLLQSNDMDQDIAKLKYCFSSLEYNKYDESKFSELRQILLKYPKTNFYLTYDFIDGDYTIKTLYGIRISNDYPKYDNRNTNWKLHTEEEMKSLVPTGVDLNKICVYLNKISESRDHTDILTSTNGLIIYPQIVAGPLNYVDYGLYETYKKPSGGKISYIEQLAHFHDNLKFVHPTLFKCAVHFYG